LKPISSSDTERQVPRITLEDERIDDPGKPQKEDRTSMLYELMAISRVLRAWKRNPNLSRREIGGWSDDSPGIDSPLTESEVERMKSFMRKYNPTSYHEMFPEDRRAVQ
jgi:hypothetical protein